MKRILHWTLLPITAVAVQELSLEQTSKLLHYKHSLSGKRHHQRTMRKMAKISPQEVTQKVEAIVKESVVQTVLMYQHRWLFYRVKTATQELRINALDGSVMTQGGKE